MKLPVPALFCALLLAGGLFVGNVKAAATATRTPHHIILSNGLLELSIPRRGGQPDGIFLLKSGRKIRLANSMYFDANGGPDHIPAVRRHQQTKKGHFALFRLHNNIQVVPAYLPGAAEVRISVRPHFWFPFHIVLHYMMPAGQTAFYAWAQVSHGAKAPAAGIAQCRFVIRNSPQFTHAVVNSKRMGRMPKMDIVKRLMNVTYLLRNGHVYTKYDNCVFEAHHYLHGVTGHGLGLWMIFASNEYLNGGPLRQNSTVYMPNVMIALFQSTHYGAGSVHVAAGQRWSKFYGPFLVYVNHGSTMRNMYANAKKRQMREASQWPYKWVHNPDYPLRRGSISGLIQTPRGRRISGAWVVLAPPGKPWAMQANGYEFWTKTNALGQFSINKIRPGTYSLYATGANHFVSFQRPAVTINPDATTALRPLIWKRRMKGKLLWQIGTANRSTREFRHGKNIRHWGNFRWYVREFPDDVNYTIGKSVPAENWNFAQWTWYCKKPWWSIHFRIKKKLSGTATLTLGIAASCPPPHHKWLQLKVIVNGQLVRVVKLKKSGMAVYRSGGQDSDYQVRYVRFNAKLLKPGTNTIHLALQGATPFPKSVAIMQRGDVGAVMYDAIRLSDSPQ
jgi:rhamnogalacturonan endolyase